MADGIFGQCLYRNGGTSKLKDSGSICESRELNMPKQQRFAGSRTSTILSNNLSSKSVHRARSEIDCNILTFVTIPHYPPFVSSELLNELVQKVSEWEIGRRH